MKEPRTPSRSLRYQVLTSENREHIVKFIVKNPGCRLSEISKAVKISLANANYHVKALSDVGLVDVFLFHNRRRYQINRKNLKEVQGALNAVVEGT